MNNQISIHSNDLDVFNFLKSINVKFEAFYTGLQTDESGWQGDSFMVKFSRDGKQYTNNDYKAGIGHRIVRKEGLTGKDKAELKTVNALPILIDHVHWTNEDRKLANKLGAPMFCRVFAITPTAASVLYGLTSDISLSSETFKDFCDNCGYDTDSRKALEIYLSCQKIGEDIRKFFTGEELATIQQLLEDY